MSLVYLSLLLRRPCPVRVAYDYQHEPDNEQRSKSRVVEKTVYGQQRWCHDQGESPYSGDLTDRSHNDP